MREVAETEIPGEPPFVDAGVKAVLERHHQFDPFEGAESQGFEGRGVVDGTTCRELGYQRFEGVRARCRRRRLPVHHPTSDLPALELASALGAWQLGFRPDRNGSNLLVVVQLRVRRPHDRIGIDVGGRHDDRMDPFPSAVDHADDGCVVDVRQCRQRLLDILRKDVEPFGGDDHLFLAPLDEETARCVLLPDVSGVQPPFGIERACDPAEVSRGEVLATHQDLAVVPNADVDSADRGTDRSLARPERMIERDDRCGFRQAIPLNDGEAEAAPELLQIRR